MKAEKVIVGSYLFRLTREDVENRGKLEAAYPDCDYSDILRKLQADEVERIARRKPCQRPAQSFTHEHDAAFRSKLKSALDLELLPDGTGRNNYARKILGDLLKIFEEKGLNREVVASRIIGNLDDFCALVVRARNADKFLSKRLVSMRNIHYELPAILKIAKDSQPKPIPRA